MTTIAASLDPLILDLLDWVAGAPRTYVEVLEAWRTSCPRLTVWEDTVDRGFVTRQAVNGTLMVCVTPAGHTFRSANSRR